MLTINSLAKKTALYGVFCLLGLLLLWWNQQIAFCFSLQREKCRSVLWWKNSSRCQWRNRNLNIKLFLAVVHSQDCSSRKNINDIKVESIVIFKWSSVDWNVCGKSGTGSAEEQICQCTSKCSSFWAIKNPTEKNAINFNCIVFQNFKATNWDPGRISHVSIGGVCLFYEHCLWQLQAIRAHMKKILNRRNT